MEKTYRNKARGLSSKIAALSLVGLLLCSNVSLSAQTANGSQTTTTSRANASHRVTGVVKSETGEPIIGASVAVEGTTLGSACDVDGAFTLNVESGQTLIISYIGYATQRIPVASRTYFDIVLKEDVAQLDEVVVVGYGTQKKVNVTGAVSTISADDLVIAPVANVSNSLAGKLPGLIVQQDSGQPGMDAASLSIRGFGEALVIVDGVESSMSNLDANEIESFTILKDASAAIYGARAGNGVILITTKRGKAGKPTIALNSTFSWQRPTAMPDVLNAGQYAEIIREAETNQGISEANMTFSAEEVQKYVDGTEAGYTGTDWQSMILKPSALMQVHNLSMSGGGDNFTYYTFLGFTDQNSLYQSGDNNYNRYNVRANIDGDINKNLSVGVSLSGIMENTGEPIRVIDEVWRQTFNLRPTIDTDFPDEGVLAYPADDRTPIASTTRDIGGYNDTIDNQYNLSANLTYIVPGVKGLSLKGFMNWEHISSENKRFEKAYTMYSYDHTSDTYSEHVGPSSSDLTETYSRSTKLTTQISANYERTFNDKHYFQALVLGEFMDYESKWYQARRVGFVTDELDQLFAGSSDAQTNDGSASETGRISYIGRLNYSYDSKYLLEATMRYDGSPNFPEDGRWGFFPSVSVGWRLSEENFLKDNAMWLDNLKLRMSMSNTGYDSVAAYQYLSGYSYNYTYMVGTTLNTGLISTGVANENITWETISLYNVGFDYSVLNNKIYGEFDLFYRHRKDVLGTRSSSLPNTMGVTLPDENINELTNRGFEFLMGYRNTVGDFSYDISGNISWSREKWKYKDEPAYTDPDDIRINQLTGQWTNITWGYETDGLFTSDAEIEQYALDQDTQGNSTICPGDIKYVDQNGDNVLDWRDKVQIGKSTTPEIMFGLNINMAYKGFDFSAQLQGAAARDVMISVSSDNYKNPISFIYDNRWSTTNNDKWAEYPRFIIGGVSNNSYASDYWIRNGSYIRLKNASLGYSVPKTVLSKVGISYLRVFVAGTNLFTISALNKYGVDPETASSLGNYYPQQKTISVGANLKF